MPIVPMAQNTERLRALPSGGLQSGENRSAEIIGRSAQRLGRTLQEVAYDQDRLEAEVDAAGAKQLDLEFSAFDRVTLFGDGSAENKGYASSEGLTALNNRGAVEEAYRKKTRELVEKARNPRQRAMLEDVLNRRVEDSLGRVGSHAQRQGEVYASTITKARIGDWRDAAIRNYEDPERFKNAMDTLENEVLADNAKWGVDGQRIAVAAARSSVHAGIVDRLSLSDPSRAMNYLDKHADVIDEDTEQKLRKALLPAVNEQEGEELVDGLLGLGTFSPGQRYTADDLMPALQGQESGGRQFGRDGKPLTSSKGAVGVAQVLPGTGQEVAKVMGIPWDEKRFATDAAYNARLGRGYLDMMLKRYDGNASLALAAYNAGPGAVDKWLKSIGDPRRGGITEGEFVARIPYEETRKYVPGVLRRMGGGGPKNAPRDDDLNGLLARIDALNLPPEQRKAARQNAISRVSMNKALLGEQEKRLEESAWSTIDAGGKVPPRVMAALPRDARLRVEGFLVKQARGETVESDPVDYVNMRRMAVENPEDFAKIDPNSWRGRFAPGDIVKLGELQADAINPAKGAKRGDTAKATMEVAKRLLPTIGIKIGNSLAAQDDAPKVDRFLRSMDERVQAHVARTGKQPTEEDLLAMGDQLLLQVRVPEPSWWNPGRKADARVYDLPADTALLEVDVPASARAEIVAEFRARGVEPSSGQIARAYTGVR